MFIIYNDALGEYIAGYKHTDGKTYYSTSTTRAGAIATILCKLDPFNELLAGARRYHNNR